MDRNNSLRLGYAPVLQDDDVHSPPITSKHDFPAPLEGLMRFWTDCGKVQGQIRAKLHSPTATSLGAAERARIAQALADQLDKIHSRKVKV